jgi:hypothetical protein
MVDDRTRGTIRTDTGRSETEQDGNGFREGTGTLSAIRELTTSSLPPEGLKACVCAFLIRRLKRVVKFYEELLSGFAIAITFHHSEPLVPVALIPGEEFLDDSHQWEGLPTTYV